MEMPYVSKYTAIILKLLKDVQELYSSDVRLKQA